MAHYIYMLYTATERVSGKDAGRQFVVAFPQHQQTAAARLYVTSCSWYPVDVVISLPGHVTRRSYHLFNNGHAVELELPSPVQLDGTNIENKGRQIGQPAGRQLCVYSLHCM